MKHSTFRPFAKCLLVVLIGLGDPAWAEEQLVTELLSGRVAMKDTGRGIPNVIVAGIWIQRGAWGTQRCFHVETAVTDPSGHYQFPGWRAPWPYGGKPGRNIELSIEPYAQKLQPVSGFKGDAYLVAFAGNRKERLDFLHRYSRRVQCEIPEEGKKLLPALEAVRDEAANLVVDIENKRTFAAIQQSIDNIRLGPEEADRLYRQRVEDASSKLPPKVLLPDTKFTH